MIHVLDASALLTICRGEPGADTTIDLLQSQDCVVSVINLSEVGAKLLDLGLKPAELDRALAQFDIDTIDFNREQALAAAAMRPITKPMGLSLGDCACLALAQRMQGKAVTADHAWVDAGVALGVPVVMVR